MHVPWAEGLTGYTKIFEQQVIGWLSETTISAVSRRMRLNQKTVASMMQRAVARGLARRRASDCSTLCVDETSFKKRHKYVTVISSPVDGAVIDVREGRTAESMSSFYRNLTPLQRHSIQRVNMDMWPAYISATRLWLEDADSKICFDRFHVMKMILDALDKVRRHEHKELRGNGSGVLTGSKYVWLTNLSKMTREDKINFADIRATVNRTSRAWSIKEAAAQLWHYLGRTWAVKEWNRWIRWARRSKLEPIKRVAATIREHLWGIVNAIVHKTNNGFAESVNAKIQLAKKRARGYRSFESFRVAILFYCGNLELNP
jgi:transposase